MQEIEVGPMEEAWLIGDRDDSKVVLRGRKVTGSFADR